MEAFSLERVLKAVTILLLSVAHVFASVCVPKLNDTILDRNDFLYQVEYLLAAQPCVPSFLRNKKNPPLSLPVLPCI